MLFYYSFFESKPVFDFRNGFYARNYMGICLRTWVNHLIYLCENFFLKKKWFFLEIFFSNLDLFFFSGNFFSKNLIFFESKQVFDFRNGFYVRNYDGTCLWTSVNYLIYLWKIFFLKKNLIFLGIFFFQSRLIFFFGKFFFPKI